eukprot:CAMPEP_0195530426 /NCGR_PEP_ID=MMETSP0794_2-20130614/33312_1 /TAXON_ID=515487 /ORGANISM="Stephanopyxis turris, Strain CCMP 815" /LENGTH=217 /DNA_ID=CAMNT_0040661941 /DNA_START=316 /DNA_END=969 /DNA_ORIENTATION=+
MAQEIPYGDVLIHAGDFTCMGGKAEIVRFCEWIATLPHPQKIVIAGNHELTLDAAGFEKRRNKFESTAENRRLVKECPAFSYLEDSGVDIGGYHFYGSPWQPEFHEWAFNLPRGGPCAEVWDRIPTETDILITHGPPLGHGDKCQDGTRAGCVDLLATITERVKPLYHISGHIHEGYGVTTNGMTTFINASTCNFFYRANNPAVVFDLPRRSLEKDG